MFTEIVLTINKLNVNVSEFIEYHSEEIVSVINFNPYHNNNAIYLSPNNTEYPLPQIENRTRLHLQRKCTHKI